MAYRQYRN